MATQLEGIEVSGPDGDRFDEIYYWDSFFIMLGLEQSGREDLLTDELNNFSTLIDRYGHIPNGNRTYYLSRSQPPFFAQMVRLVDNHEVRMSIGWKPGVLPSTSGLYMPGLSLHAICSAIPAT